MLRKTSLFLLILQVEALESGLGNLKVAVVEKLRKTGYIDGHFIIGALFPIHAPPAVKDDMDPLECGALEKNEGIELVEAAFYAIDAINKDENLLPGIKLGINIKDNCDSAQVALYQTIKLIEEPKLKDDNSTLSSFTCSNHKSDNSSLIGVIGTVTGASTLQAENLLKLFEIPQIGYTTSPTELKSPYFYLSVAPSDYHQAYLIIKMLKKFNWNYISVAYTDGHPGMNTRYFLEQWVAYYNICIFASVHLTASSEELLYVHSAKQLLQDERAKVIVCFCDETILHIIFEEIRNQNAAGKFLVMISSDWPISETALSAYKQEAEGSLMLSIRRNSVPEFDDYFLRRNLANNKRNPWFKEYWELKSKCRSNIGRNSNRNLCGKYKQSTKIPYIIESIQAFARGLHNMYSNTCGPVTNFCPEMKSFNTITYMEYLTNLSFSFNGNDINFHFHGTPYVGRFDIYNFQTTNNSYKYVKIGEYDCHHMHEQMNHSDEEFFQNLNIFEAIQYPKGAKSVVSTCSEPCPTGEVQVYNSEQPCCWSCISCTEDEIPITESDCQRCPEGFWPNRNKTVCEQIPITYVKCNEIRSLLIIATSGLLIILTLITSFIFVRHRHTPVVKCSHRELYYMILFGLISVHIGSILLVIQPTAVVCTTMRCLFSLGFTLIYIPVLLISCHIARLISQSKKQHPNLNLRLTSLKEHVIIIASTFAIQIIILTIEWTKIWHQPRVIYQIEPFIRGYMICYFPTERWSNTGFLFLQFVMIFYAIKIRKISSNFNEAKFISIYTFIQVATNMTFRLVYDSSEFQIISMLLCISLDSFSTLLLLFFPKLYVILWRPEKNTNENFKSLSELFASD